jgi:hypothetical protein
MIIMRQWREVLWMVEMTVLEASTSIITAVLPSSPLMYVYQPKALVNKQGYHIIITRDTPVNRILND